MCVKDKYLMGNVNLKKKDFPSFWSDGQNVRVNPDPSPPPQFGPICKTLRTLTFKKIIREFNFFEINF